MSWKIFSKSDSVEYRLGDCSYSTDRVECVGEEFFNEPGAYKEPDDTVCVATFEAHSEHGKFVWKVSARRSGFETFPVIEDIFLVVTPDPRIDVDDPIFDVEFEV